MKKMLLHCLFVYSIMLLSVNVIVCGDNWQNSPLLQCSSQRQKTIHDSKKTNQKNKKEGAVVPHKKSVAKYMYIAGGAVSVVAAGYSFLQYMRGEVLLVKGGQKENCHDSLNSMVNKEDSPTSNFQNSDNNIIADNNSLQFEQVQELGDEAVQQKKKNTKMILDVVIGGGVIALGVCMAKIYGLL